jgi:hypothetical protein
MQENNFLRVNSFKDLKLFFVTLLIKYALLGASTTPIFFSVAETCIYTKKHIYTPKMSREEQRLTKSIDLLGDTPLM